MEFTTFNLKDLTAEQLKDYNSFYIPKRIREDDNGSSVCMLYRTSGIGIMLNDKMVNEFKVSIKYQPESVMRKYNMYISEGGTSISGVRIEYQEGSFIENRLKGAELVRLYAINNAKRGWIFASKSEDFSPTEIYKAHEEWNSFI